jgi:hypothetical protein
MVRPTKTTSGGNVSKRLAKIQAVPAAEAWLACPSRKIAVRGWAKRGARGQRKTWTCREVEILPRQTTEET